MDVKKQISRGKIVIEKTAHRPKKIMINRKLLRGKTVQYVRNANECLSLGRGLSLEIRGSLSLIIDLMALEGGAIPAEPIEYVAGLIGCTGRKFNQTILPALEDAGILRKKKIKGIVCIVWADREKMSNAVRPFISSPTLGRLDDRLDFNQGLLDKLKDPKSSSFRGNAILQPAPGPIDVASPETVAAQPTPEVPLVTPAPPEPVEPNGQFPREATKPAPVDPIEEMVPKPSAMEVLEQAGIDVGSHPSGPLFWARTEHESVLAEWLEHAELGKIIKRLHDANANGQLPENVNSLRHYTSIAAPEVTA